MFDFFIKIGTNSIFLPLLLFASVIIILVSIPLFIIYIYISENKKKKNLFLSLSIIGTALFIIAISVLLGLEKETNAKITNIQTIENRNNYYLLSIESEKLGNTGYLVEKRNIEISGFNKDKIKNMKDIDCTIKYMNFSDTKIIEKVVIEFKE